MVLCIFDLVSWSTAMTLQQLTFLREIVRSGMNISSAAATLGTSQPGISRQIRLLEQSLGMPVLVRRRNRIIGLTELGEAVAKSGERLLNEAESIRQIAADASAGGGRLVVATSHLHARYTLLGPFGRLRIEYPNLEMLLLQFERDDVLQLVQTGEADIGVSTGIEADAATMPPDVALLGGNILRRSAIIPKGHPLARAEHLSLAEIAEHPLIGYGPNAQTGQQVVDAFSALGLVPRYVVRASNSDIIQAYVEQGLGVGIVPTGSVEGKTNLNLVARDVTSLLPPAQTIISLRRGTYLRRHLVDFIRMVAPGWDRVRIQRHLDHPGPRRNELP